MFLLLLFPFLALCQPSLPLPAHDIPKNLNPPLNHGRVDYHGWLWLPWLSSQSQPTKTLQGYFYHHTPEFWTDSPHNFEIMASGQLDLDKAISGMPIPPATGVIGTEYVFTPPAFSLDDMITRQVTSYVGKFTNGSFDTPQRYLLSMAKFTVKDMLTVHYLEQNATAGYKQLPYLSYPRNPHPNQKEMKQVQHFYFLHLLEQSPDFDQIIHVTIDPLSCSWQGTDSFKDLNAVGATFVLPSIQNDVLHRLMPSSEVLNVELRTDATRNTGNYSTCKMVVLEEIHCVVVPNSFDNCPPVVKDLDLF